MIIFDGDYSRLLHQMMEEVDRVNYYRVKCQNGIVRKFRQTKVFPVWYSEVITLPRSNNTYLVYYYAKNANENDFRFNHFHGALLMLNDEKGHRMVVTYRDMTIRKETAKGLVDSDVNVLQVYSGHFFSRYRERMGLSTELTANDLITTFFGRNGHYFTMLDYDRIVLEKNRSKGNCAWAVEDGVILSEKLEIDDFYVLKHKTFLSNSELKPGQKEATPSISWMRSRITSKK